MIAFTVLISNNHVGQRRILCFISMDSNRPCKNPPKNFNIVKLLIIVLSQFYVEKNYLKTIFKIQILSCFGWVHTSSYGHSFSQRTRIKVKSKSQSRRVRPWDKGGEKIHLWDSSCKEREWPNESLYDSQNLLLLTLTSPEDKKKIKHLKSGIDLIP